MSIFERSEALRESKIDTTQAEIHSLKDPVATVAVVATGSALVASAAVGYGLSNAAA